MCMKRLLEELRRTVFLPIHFGRRQEQQGLEKKRKLNPLETLLMVYTQTSARKDARPDRQYPFFTGLPLKPYFDRPTVRTEEIPGVMWAFEQPQEFFNVSVNIRMTAVRLEGGGLWVHAPVAPTEECVNLVEELGEEVRYIVLPTTAFEHKVYVKPFSDRFPRAQVYACPGQWSWPINLPPSFRVDGVLCEGERAPWEDEFECKLFSPPIGGVGPSNEVGALIQSVPFRDRPPEVSSVLCRLERNNECAAEPPPPPTGWIMTGSRMCCENASINYVEPRVSR
ncbi:conserved unknown protein [Ectocarpus siliculosus]|uniref:Uncharacterized protein n=1 Tax=Ectocarpus siliculosus TaxID=2880 RepID=D7FXU9_ECTSI|nr:conserved unknown protein [Ectocarpus siliculosus]|eukprot:CBJ32362.1 conserved unknown protein [Ectocarpus siliculosus]